MEDKSMLITIKTEIKEEILEDQATVTDRFGLCEEHNYNKIMSDDHYFYSQLHHSINIKEERDNYIDAENSCSSEIENETVSSIKADVHAQENILMASYCCGSQQQIKAFENDKVGCASLLTEKNQFINTIKNEVPTKCSSQHEIFKTEDFDYDLAELHHSINIKEEVEFMDSENAEQEEYNSDAVRPFLGSQYSIINNNHLRNNTQGNSKIRTNEARWGQNAEEIVDDAMEIPINDRTIPKNTIHGQNSRRRAFEAFCEARKVEITETTPVKEIARILKDYAFNMRRQDGNDYKESTLKTHWNSTARDLQSRFYQEYGIKFDAFKDVEFAEARKARDSKRKILQSDPEKRKETSTAFTIEEHSKMVKAYDESTPEGLSHKFFLVASKELGWRTNEAVAALTDYFVEEVGRNGTLTGSIRYNPGFSHSKRIVEDKWLVPNSNDEMCPVRLYRKMMSKRPKGGSNRLFLNADPHWRLNKTSWYIKSPVGKNTLGTWTKEASEKIGVKGKRFPIHSTKATVMTKLTTSNTSEVQMLKTPEKHTINEGKSHQNLIGKMQTGPSGSGNVAPQVKEAALRTVNLQRNNVQQYKYSADPPPLIYII